MKFFHSLTLMFVMFMLGFTMVLPFFSNKQNFIVVADENIEPFIYDDYVVSDNSFGIGNHTIKNVNKSYFISWIRNTFGWKLQQSDGYGWVDCNQNMVIYKVWNPIHNFFKIKLNFTSDNIGSDGYNDYRFILYTNETGIEYIQFDNHTLIMNYSFNENETYHLYFDYSDIYDLPNLIFGKGIKNGYHYWFVRKNNVPDNRNYSLDPSFGYTSVGFTQLTCENNINAGRFQFTGGANQQADEICVFLVNSDFMTAYTDEVTCYLYEDDDDLLAQTECKNVNIPGMLGSEWVTFTFSSPPTLVNDAYYNISVWAESGAGNLNSKYDTSGGNGVWQDSETYSCSTPIDPYGGSLIDSDGKASIYCNYSAIAVPPTINSINFAGNLSDDGGPYWRPPGETTQLTGVHSDGYYTNASKQKEDWIYINVSVVNADNVYLDWYNKSSDSWINNTNLNFVSRGSNYWDINTSDETATLKDIGCGHLYSFNINASSGGGSDTYEWNKTAPGGGYTRRYVQLDCSPVTLDYSSGAFYLVNYTDGTGDYPTYGASDLQKRDRLYHDQAGGETIDDCGYMNSTMPTSDTMNLRYCGTYTGYWFEENISAESFTLENIYWHFWYSSNSGTGDSIGVKEAKTRSYLPWLSGHTLDYNHSHIVWDSGESYGGTPLSDDYYLTTYYEDIPDLTFTDNSIYEFCVMMGGVAQPSTICNRSVQSFILFNVPSNATLNSTYPDSDSDYLSDWKELYVTYTNPFVVDTDNDGVTDYDESISGSDPNNFSDATSLVFKNLIVNQAFTFGNLSSFQNLISDNTFTFGNLSSFQDVISDNTFTFGNVSSYLNLILDQTFSFGNDSVSWLDTAMVDNTFTFGNLSSFQDVISDNTFIFGNDSSDWTNTLMVDYTLTFGNVSSLAWNNLIYDNTFTFGNVSSYQNVISDNTFTFGNDSVSWLDTGIMDNTFTFGSDNIQWNNLFVDRTFTFGNDSEAWTNLIVDNTFTFGNDTEVEYTLEDIWDIVNYMNESIFGEGDGEVEIGITSSIFLMVIWLFLAIQIVSKKQDIETYLLCMVAMSYLALYMFFNVTQFAIAEFIIISFMFVAFGVVRIFAKA